LILVVFSYKKKNVLAQKKIVFIFSVKKKRLVSNVELNMINVFIFNVKNVLNMITSGGTL